MVARVASATGGSRQPTKEIGREAIIHKNSSLIRYNAKLSYKVLTDYGRRALTVAIYNKKGIHTSRNLKMGTMPITYRTLEAG